MGKIKKGPAGEGRVEKVPAGTPKDFLSNHDTETHSHRDLPERDGGRKGEWKEYPGNQEPLVYLVAPNTCEEHFPGTADCHADEVAWQEIKSTVNQVTESGSRIQLKT
jgi:hypothetical protein